ncbi:TonB-dependent receptor [Porphyrobacter algicida]|uniref:TonB-dependent receptor n=1 Tax=Qipengyuania algicida TaxID=1836209 RepID=A0A845ALA9_9SPHN|nr:TonB-dependent receptor [Qipengyuania algicida]MXP29645.1 TonB-dependent receptor [Qipengyuania algicida]
MLNFRSSASLGVLAAAIATPAMAQTVNSQPAQAAANAPGTQAQGKIRKGGVQTIVVTAQKRTQDLQDVPISVQALGEEGLEQLNVNTFKDYLKQLPSVTAGGSGPGQSTIYIRGLASTTPNLTTAGVAGLAPNVSLYLDDQPLSQPGRNLDVYAADLARIEVLAGPQGTLFGASSQAGVVRLITNEPKLGVFEGRVTGGVSFTKHGDMSEKATAVLNVPVTDSLAVRGVVYLDHQGGYIDNVHGTRDASESGRFREAGTVRYNGVPVSPGRAGFQAGADLSNVNLISADNTGLVKDNFNTAQYTGFRVSALWEINPDWKLKVAHMRQSLDTDGVFFEDPTLGDLKIQRYMPDTMNDRFSNTAWTLEGQLGALNMVYTGAFTDRKTDQTVDYSDYLFVGQYLPYYICDTAVVYPTYVSAAPADPTCQAPNLSVKSHSEMTKITQELRFSTPDDWRFRVQAGGFFSRLVLKERNDFFYPGSVNVRGSDGVTTGFVDNYPLTNVNAPPGMTGNASAGYFSDPGPFPPGVIFRNDVKRTDRQIGLFGQADFDIVPDKLTATFGLRYYDVEVGLFGSANSSFYNLNSAIFGPNAGVAPGTAIDAQLGGTNISALYAPGNPAGAPTRARSKGVIVKGTLTYKPVSGVLFYGTYSQGFRPGLLNRPGGATKGNYTVPYALQTDNVDNYEIGAKLELFDNQLVFNASAFYVDITNLQTTIFDPSIVNLFFSDNAADAWIKGAEGQFTFAPYAVPGLTLAGAFSLLDTKITKVLTPTNDVQLGSHLAYAPPFQGNLRVRYEWALSNTIDAHIMPSVVHSASKFTDIIDINKLRLKGYTTFGLTAGIAKDNWTFEIYGDNLTDERAQISGDFYYDRPRVVTNRPLTVGARFSVDF